MTTSVVPKVAGTQNLTYDASGNLVPYKVIDGFKNFSACVNPLTSAIKSIVWTYETLRLVAVGAAGSILTSITGEVWTQQNAGLVSVTLNRVRQLWDLTIIVGNSPAASPGTILVGGINSDFAAKTSLTGNNINLYDVAYQPTTQVIACGTADANGPVLVKSTDRAGTFTTWSKITPVGLTGTGDGLCITYAGGYFWLGTSTGYLMKSADGVTWTQVIAGGTGNKFNKIVYNGTRMLILSGAFVGNSYYSDDLNTFTGFATNIYKPWRDLDYYSDGISNAWVACNDSDPYPYASTDNGLTFHPLMCARDYTAAQFISSAVVIRPTPLTYYNPLGNLPVSETQFETEGQLIVGDSVGGKIFRSNSLFPLGTRV